MHFIVGFQRLVANKIRNHDLSECVPTALLGRLKKCINLADFKLSSPSENVPETIGAESTIAVLKGGDDPEQPGNDTDSLLNPSTMSDIAIHPDNVGPVVLRIDPPPEPRRPKASGITHWASKMIQQPRAERVRWPSKIYKSDRKTSHLGQFQQTAERMDWAAEDFTNWLEAFADDHEAISKPTVNKALIKQMFSITQAMDASNALVTIPTQRKVIPEAVAQSQSMPKRSVDYQVQQQLQQIKDQQHNSKRPKRQLHAFGRSFAKGDEPPRVMDENIQPLVPNFPLDIRTKRSVFQGIAHLRSTRIFVQFLEENPDIRRPTYLVDKNMFSGSELQRTASIDGPVKELHVPLYKHFVTQLI